MNCTIGLSCPLQPLTTIVSSSIASNRRTIDRQLLWVCFTKTGATKTLPSSSRMYSWFWSTLVHTDPNWRYTNHRIIMFCISSSSDDTKLGIDVWTRVADVRLTTGLRRQLWLPSTSNTATSCAKNPESLWLSSQRLNSGTLCSKKLSRLSLHRVRKNALTLESFRVERLLPSASLSASSPGVSFMRLGVFW